MNREFYTPNDFECGNDGERIQSAITAACKNGCRKVVIPHFNNDKEVWDIDKTITLPSDITIILDNCCMRMADGFTGRMFENENADTAIGNTLEGEQKNIFIRGMGNAILDGGEDNGLNEFTSGKNGLPSVWQNLTIFLFNVKNFEVSGITIRNQRWWAMAFAYATDGKINDIKFVLDSYKGGEGLNGTWRNQDGIDLRVGCRNIVISNISGEVGDDAIALTSLPYREFNKTDANPKISGKSNDISNIVIDKICCISHMCALVRLLSHFGNKIHDISISNIIDSGQPVKNSKVQMAIRIGDDISAYYMNKKENRAKLGDISNIFINKVFTRALTAIHIETNVMNLHVTDIAIRDDAHHAVTFGRFELNITPFMYVPKLWENQKKQYLIPIDDENAVFEGKNILIENVYAAGEEDDVPLFVSNYTNIDNVAIKNVNASKKMVLSKQYNQNNFKFEDIIKNH